MNLECETWVWSPEAGVLSVRLGSQVLNLLRISCFLKNLKPWISNPGSWDLILKPWALSLGYWTLSLESRDLIHTSYVWGLDLESWISRPLISLRLESWMLGPGYWVWFFSFVLSSGSWVLDCPRLWILNLGPALKSWYSRLLILEPCSLSIKSRVLSWFLGFET